MKPNSPAERPVERAPDGTRVLIIEARFYGDLADEMAAGAEAALAAAGAGHDRIAVPGALEIPQALALAVAAGRLGGPQATWHGVVALGCVIRGETSHYDIVCNNANHWLMDVALRTGVPVGNAILTVESLEQAWERADRKRLDKGADAARACLALIGLRHALGSASGRS